MSVNTAKVAGRRQLKFNSLDDILADVDRMNQGKVRSLGNWSPGQVLKHCTIVMNGCLDGIDVKAPWVMRIFAALCLRNRFVTRPMSAGFKLPKSAAALLPDETTWDDGVRGIRVALTRMKAENQRHPHPLLGTLTREQWDQLHCRHCELHLSFLVAQ
jgi:hypothetical protein